MSTTDAGPHGRSVTIVVDRGRCTGIGICESVAPEHFEVDDDGTLIVTRDSPDAAERDLVERAVRSCPARALSLLGRSRD
jgi:ferredoxin